MSLIEKIKKTVNSNFHKQKNQTVKLLIIIAILPFILFVYLPIYIINRLFFFKKIELKRNYNKEKEILEVPKDIIKREDRKYDLVLFGVTGFTGKLCFEYLIKNYPELNFAISGRNRQKIEKIVDDYETKKDILICDTSDYEDLIKIIKDTKVVISTVGPFFQYGNPIVNICSAYGTDYCDITGEFYFVKENIAKYDNLANKTGSRIVSFCGLDSLPFDITTFMLNKIVKENDKEDKLKKINQYIFGKLSSSGGTLQTAINTLEMKEKRVNFQNKNPILKLTGKNELSKNKCKNSVIKSFKFVEDINHYCSFSPLSLANQRIIERSNNLLNYNVNLIYEEGLAQKSLINSIFQILRLILMYLFITFKFVKNLLFKFNLILKPGEGQDIKELKKGYLDLITIGETEKNKKFVTNLKINSDPGYIETAKMLVESGLTFVFNNDKITKEGGVHTTASCFGSEVLERLKSAGFEYKSLN